MKKVTQTLLFLCMALLSVSGFAQINKTTVYFNSGKSNLSKETMAQLDALIKNMSGECSVSVAGHTDNTGGETLNQNLSLARANEVSAYLASKGVSMAKMSIS